MKSNKTRVLAMVNLKGGVAKTTTAINMGALVASDGYRTLLVDMDAQASLTFSISQDEGERTVYDALSGNAKAPIVSVRENLSLMPSDVRLSMLDADPAFTQDRLKKVLQGIAGDYDFIIIDCPPSFGMLTMNALAAADEVVIPVVAEGLSYKGVRSIIDFIDAMKKVNDRLEFRGIVITRWERIKVSSVIEGMLREDYGEKVFNTKIRKNVAVCESQLMATDVSSYAPSSASAKDYRELTDEYLKRINLK